MERMQKYDLRRSFEGWLFAVAHNLAIDYVRRRQPESFDEPTLSGKPLSSHTQSTDAGALEALLSQERANLVIGAIVELPGMRMRIVPLLPRLQKRCGTRLEPLRLLRFGFESPN
jgi:DNA-directed RNA polymerase specialized sigma24 family protein